VIWLIYGLKKIEYDKIKLQKATNFVIFMMSYRLRYQNIRHQMTSQKFSIFKSLP